jgi:hypothetical protein
MKLKSLFALALIMTAVGLQQPAAAEDRDGNNTMVNIIIIK